MTYWDLPQAGSTFENQCNPSHQQVKEEKSHAHINMCRKNIWQNSTTNHDKKKKKYKNLKDRGMSSS